MKYLLKYLKPLPYCDISSKIKRKQNQTKSLLSKAAGLFLLLTAGQFLIPAKAEAVPLSLKREFVGYYNYAVTGGTLRTNPNSVNACTVGNSNTASLSGIPATATIKAAYLYWAGSGNTSDNTVTFQGQSVTADTVLTDTFTLSGTTYKWFSGIKDVTSIVATTRNGNYTLSDLSVATGSPWCNIQGVLSGWSLIVVYEDSTTVTRPFAINLYDGFSTSRNAFQDFTISGIKVSNAPVSKFTALLWEGDHSLGGTNEFFSFEGNKLSDASNVVNNPFNSSINTLGLGADTVYGVDLDTFDVSAYTTPGATSVTGRISSENDLVILSAAVVGVTTFAADLEVNKTVSSLNPVVGQNITYTVTVTNKGPDNTTGVVVKDVLPSQVTHVSNDSGGSYTLANGNWNVGNLNVGESKTLNITVTVNNTGTFNNTAEVTASDLIDLDSKVNNNNGTEDDQASVSVTASAGINISGTLYQDTNGNDTLTSGEPTLPTNITVKLLDSTGTTTIATTTTNASGQYTFTGITNGNYQVQVDTTDTDIPTGLTLGTPNNLTVNVSGSPITNQNFGFDIATGFCNLGGGTNDPTIQPYISTEAGNTSVAGSIPSNLRSLTDQLDDTWRTAAGGSTTGTVEPWFGVNSAPGSATNFTYKEPNSNTAIATTVESVQVPFTTATTCNGGNAAGSGFALAFGNSLQDSSPRPASLYNTADEPGFWNHTGGSSDSKRNAVRFTFAQPVKSFGAWFGDLETRTQSGGAPAYLRLLDASGNRIGQDIAITPQTLDNGTTATPNPQPLDQTNCSTGATPQLGCGNQTSRWVGFVDTNASARIKQVLVIVGDDDDTGNGDTERLSFIGSNLIPVSSNPNILLVKRITAINGVPFNQFIDDPNSTDDNDPKWPTPANTYLRGVIDGGVVKPGDELEYTIYFLSRGDGAATNVSVCDLVPSNTTFLPTAFNGLTPTDGSLAGANLGVALALDSANLPSNPNFYLSNVADTDRGQFFAAGTTPPISCSGTNNNGALVVNLVKKPDSLPRATAPGTPTNSYGFIRFRAVVK